MAHDITLGQILLDTSADYPAHPNVAKFGDIDGDGDLDIVIGVDKAGGTKGSEVWKNDGSGNFKLHQTLAGLRVQDLWLVNIDGDSALEMITQEIEASPRVWQNDGLGTFTSVATPTGNTSDVAVGDVDGDGNVDLVVGRWQQNQYEIYKNNGAGTFTLASSVTGAGYVRSVALVDMDRNGTLDIVAFENAVGGRMLSNDGTGTFTSVATFGDSYGYDVLVADLSGDGHADLIVNGGSGTSEPFRLYRNDGSFSLGAELQTFTTGLLPTPSVFGDIDNDGDIDGLGHALLLNGGGGTFTNSNTALQDPSVTYSYYSTPTVVDGQVIGVGDADGDGDLDFVVSFLGRDDSDDVVHLPRVRLFINNTPISNADGTLTASATVSEPISLPTSADTVGEAVNVFDFTLADGGGGDGVALGVSSLVVHTSGTGDFSKVTWRLNGPDATNVAGIYNAGSNTITFSGLGISVNDGGTETYTINAYFNNTTGLTSGQTYLLSIDGDTDVTTTSGSTRMAASQSPVNNGSGSAIIANTAPTATNLTQNFVFIEDSSDVALEDIVITDPDSSDTFTATLTLSNAAAGSLTTGTFGGSTSTYNPGTGQWIVAGTLDDVNAALASVSFAPAANWDQSVTITTQVRDSSGSGPTNGTITLSATAVNDAPTLTATGTNPTFTENGAAVSLFSGTTISAIETGQAIGRLTLTVTNVADGSAEVLRVDGTDVALANGNSLNTVTNGLTVNVSVSGSTATLDISKAAGISSNAAAMLVNSLAYSNTSNTPTTTGRTITLTSVSDNGGTANGGVDTTALSITTTVSITAVNDAPTISGPASINVSEDVATSIAGITFSDVDVGTGSVRVIFSVANGNGTFTATASSGVTISNNDTNAITLQGTVADINTMVSNGRLIYLGALNATGDKTMSISINDNGNTGSGGALQDNASISLLIAAVNDAPVNNLPAAQTVPQDGSLVFNSANGNLITISDVDAGGNVIQLSLTASHGQMTLGSIVGLTFSTGDGTNDTTMAFMGDLAAINAALNGLTFTPQAGYNGLGSITFVSDDLGNSGSGGAKTDSDTINITVNPLNPTVVNIGATNADDSYKAGSTLTLTVTFDQNVTVDTTSGTPVLLLDLGQPGRQATYASGSGGTVLSFTYTVQAGDNSADLDYLDSSALQLNGATIKNTDGDDAVLILPTPGTAGSLGANQNVVIDTTAPTQTFSSLQFSDDTGGSGTDFVTKTASQTLTATLSAVLGNGDKVYGSLDDGATWLDITAKILGTTLTWNGITLAGSGTLRLKLTDAAGNDGSVASQTYVLDTTAPSFDPATSTPADNTTSVAVANNIVIAFSEALTATGSDLAKVYLRDVATDTLVPASISINSNGALVINPTGNLAYGTAYYVTWDASALRDAAGNAAAAVSDETTYNFTTQAAPPSPPEQPSTPTVPAPVPVPVDGALVTTQTGADGTITTTIAPVTSGRVDDPSTPNNTLADVPLFQSGGNPVLLASLPVGFGLSASTPGLSTAGNSLTDLVRQIQQHTAAGSQDQSQLTSGGASFLGGLPSTTPLLVQIIVPTYQGSGMPGQALGISGQPAVTGQPLTALVINASGLPSGTSLQLNNVEFAAIIGSVSVSGGAGSQHVWGDGASQTIFLGADDDVLHGGGGNDTVGSLGGNDQVFGDAGDDIVFGGTGHDTLSGGTGNDRLDGGLGWDTALQIGSVADYTLSMTGDDLILTHNSTGEVDHLKSVEMITFDTGASLYIADSEAEAALAHIATHWLGRDLTAEEGAQFQAYSHLTALEVAQAVLRGPYGEQFQGHTAEELIAGWQDNAQIVRMDVTAERVQGSTGVDAINYGVKLADAHLQWVSNGVWEGTSRINGDMVELHNIERLHLNDASVALDGANLAALIAVTLGEASLQDRAITSEGLALMDSGWSNQAIGAAALQLAMGAGTHTAQDTVQWLWTKAYGSAGTAEQLQPYVQQLQAGATTVGDLAWEAAQYALANPKVALAGVLQQGLVYDTVVI